jgi:sulfatase modifying factor 1
MSLPCLKALGPFSGVVAAVAFHQRSPVMPAVDRHWLIPQFVSAAFALVFGALGLPHVHAVTIDWVTVGNPRNDPDPATGSLYGAVNYEFRMAKYLVTIQQYTDFLNAVAATDLYSLYKPLMATSLNTAGISQSGTSGGYSYSVIDNGGPSGNRPMMYVSWFDAARFANWMHNGQGSGSTETGAYTLVDGQTSGTAPAKNPGAQFYIPTENEWYKAAYYSPVLNSGSGGYYTYATQSNTPPGNIIGGGANQANYNNDTYSVTGVPFYDSNQNYLTDVGAFTDSASFYGTFDQSGNVYEWNDLDGTSGSSRGFRGGYWSDNAFLLSSSSRFTLDPSFENDSIFGGGFRLASPVPEPATLGMASGGLLFAGGWWFLKRRRRAR